MGITKHEHKLDNWFRFLISCDRCGAEFSLMERRIDWLRKKLDLLGYSVKGDIVDRCPKCDRYRKDRL